MQICNPLCTIGDCYYKTTWQAWDGARLIREERRPYPDGGTPNVRYGSVDYIHGLELDRPLAANDGRLATARILNSNWRGLFEASVTTSGAGADCSVIGGSCSHIPWPAGYPVYARAVPWEPADGSVTFTWSGSLLLDQQDGTGNLYRRNRYYDPVAGRFTQEDPIGLAGGLNVYGFAEGDPVNFDDPFGLCPESAGGDGATDRFDDCPRLSSGWWAHRVATGRGNQIINEVMGTIRACGEDEQCGAGLSFLGGPRLSTRSVGPSSTRTVGQMRMEVRRGQAPKGVKRVGKSRHPHEQDNVHFDGGQHSLNRDGSWKHGGRKLTNDEERWLRESGWKIPRK